MPLVYEQRAWFRGIVAGLTSLSDNRWMMPTDHLATILTEIGRVIENGVGGAVVEMGCAGGRTSLRIAALLQLLGEGSGRLLHVYDSFEGFPTLTPEDYPGDTSKENLRYCENGLPGLFAEWGDGLLLPVVHKGFFTEEGDHPNPIAFALIDCDAYESLRTALRIVWPRVAAGGVVAIHDYGNPSWPGVKQACDAWLSTITAPHTVYHNSLLVVTRVGVDSESM